MDVLGFPEVGGFGVAMKSASLTRLRSGVHFDPIEITPEDAIAGSFESQLVQLEGTVMNGFVERADSVIVLRSGPYLFDVRLPLDESLISGVTKRLETGAQIRVAGICSLILDRSRDLIVPRGFEILLSSASGITVLKDAPWLTMSHLLTLSIVMLFVVTLALGWIAMLRRNVRLQTRKLEQANAVTSEALDRARQAESLEQNRKAILELIAKDEPLEKIMARMARAVVQHMPRTLCTIHLHSSCDSRIALSAEGAEKLMGALSRIPLSPALEASIWKPVSGLFASEDWDGMAVQFAEAGLQGYFAVPILRDSQQAGLIFTFWPEGLVPTEEEVDILESWGRFAGLSVERRGHYQQLSHKAHHDTLTGLYNRASLFEHLEKQLSRTAESSVAVLYIDLDGFKPINDKHGHGAGDAVLQEVSRRIVAKIRQTDVAARMGGDEFVVVLSGIRDRPEAERVGEDLVECIRQPMLIACRELQVSASLGVSLFPDDDSNAEALLKGADQAMYNAKALNRNLGKIELRQTGESLLVA